MPVDGYEILLAARRRELESWPLVAAILYELHEKKVKWWHGKAENERDALEGPELQMPHTTAHQYRVLWQYFGEFGPERLSKVRPRLLYQTIKDVREGTVTAAEALSDAEVLSWGQMRTKYDLRM